METQLNEVEIIAFTKDSFKDSKTGQDIEYRYVLLRSDGSLFRVAVDKELDLTSSVGSVVDLGVSFSPSADRASRVKVTSLL